MRFYNYWLKAPSISVPCEVAVKRVLPVVRAMIARKFTVSHVLRQVEAAELLGVSQPATSLYCRNIQAFAFSSAEVLIQISQFEGEFQIEFYSPTDFPKVRVTEE